VVKLGRLLDRRMQETLDPLGLTAGQYLALADVARRPGISRADLARDLQLTPQAVGGLVDTLATRGLLTRTRHEPGHPIELDLTASGLRTVEQAHTEVHRLSRHLLGQCVRPESVPSVENAFRRILDRLRRT
jgi:DNA-binding MarR family transcriptional regulator